MSFWRKLQYLRPSYRRDLEKDMKEELDSLKELAQAGELGNITRVAEDARAAWGWTTLEQIYRDVQYALRAMRHSPAFTATAVLSLALGIGANTAIFSLIDALMLRWLPVRDPQELVQIQMRTAGAERASGTLSYSIARGLADQRDIFSSAVGFSGASFNVGQRGSLSRIPGAWVTGGYYETLGLNPLMGRLLTQSDDEPGAPLVAVLSHGYWERQMGRDAAVVGRSLSINGVPVTIVGVSPRGFTGANVGADADITMAAGALPRIQPEAASLLNPGNFWLRILARPRKDMSLAQAKARLDVVWPQLAERVINKNWPAARRREMAQATLEMVPGGTGYTYLREMFRRPLLVLMGVVALVLLIACVNVANLLLARAAARQREIAVRLAIGASRGRIIRQLLTESMLMSSLGTILGICLAWFASRFLIDTLSIGGHYRGSPFPVTFDLSPNGHVLAFASAVALVTGLLFGLAPAFQTTAMGSMPVTAGDARMPRSRSRLLSVLVSVQVALSLVLLVGAGLFVRTLRNLLDLDPGFHREGVLLVNVDGRQEGYRDARLAPFYKELLDRILRVPGVESASISSHTPLSGSTWSEAAVPRGRPVPERDNALFIAVGPNYFGTMQTPLLSGREFSEHDEGKPSVAIVNQAFAARHFPGRNPVGQYLSATMTKPPADLEVVGVVKDTSAVGLRAAPPPTVYVSWSQHAPTDASFEIRAAGSLSQVASAIRKELQPKLPGDPPEVSALSDQVERTLVQEHLMASLAGGFGMLGLILACVGLYGLMAYSVARRTAEIGVRMALGARQRSVMWMVVRDAIRLVVFGIALGLPGAWIASRGVKSMLFGLTATDPAAMAMAVVLLGTAALVAAYSPARRAARVDPMMALRHD